MHGHGTAYGGTLHGPAAHSLPICEISVLGHLSSPGNCQREAERLLAGPSHDQVSVLDLDIDKQHRQRTLTDGHGAAAV